MKNIETKHEPMIQPDQAEQAVQFYEQTQSAETKEINGPEGPEPTRYGDWERKGRCVDF